MPGDHRRSASPARESAARFARWPELQPGRRYHDGGRACAPLQVTGEHDPTARAPHRRNAMAQTVLAVTASSWAVLMGIAPVLQIRRMLRQRSSRDVSVGYFTILLVGFVLWIVYGAAAGIIALVIPNTVALLTGATVVIVALLLRRPPSRRTSAPPDGRAQH